MSISHCLSQYKNAGTVVRNAVYSFYCTLKMFFLSLDIRYGCQEKNKALSKNFGFRNNVLITFLILLFYIVYLYLQPLLRYHDNFLRFYFPIMVVSILFFFNAHKLRSFKALTESTYLVSQFHLTFQQPHIFFL